MKTSQALFVFAALFITMCSAAPSNSAASHSNRLHVDCAAIGSALRAPIVHLRFSGDSIIFELGYRLVCAREATAPQSVKLTITVTRTVKAELLLRTRHFRFAIPRRSA